MVHFKAASGYNTAMVDKSKRRWFAFRLRTLFVLMAVVAAIAAPFALREHRERERKERVRIQREQTLKFYDSGNLR